MNFSLLINCLSLSFSLIEAILSLMFLLLICIRIRPLKSNVPLILTCNTYITSLISSLLVFKVCCQSIYGVLNPSISYDVLSCQIDGYLIYAAIGNVFYSFVLQAIFRLFRIVFYRKKTLHSLRVFSIGIVIQWTFIFLINLIFLLLNDIEYIASVYHCQVSYTNLRGSFMILFIEYMIPANIMYTIYFYIIRYIRRINNRMNIRRDMVVFKQVLILFISVQILFLPVGVFWILSTTNDYLRELSYQLQELTMAFSQVFLPIILAFSTPHIREIFQWRRRIRVHPIVREGFVQNELFRARRQQRF